MTSETDNFTWWTEVSEMGVWHTSRNFYIKDVENIAFQNAVRVISKDEIEIRIQKGYLELAKAMVEISLANRGTKQTVEINNWRCVYTFPKFPMPRNSPLVVYQNGIIKKHYIIQMTCTIKWHGFLKDSLRSVQYDNFKDYSMSHELSDIIIAIDDVELPAHKIILAAQSPVFLKMFSTDTNGSVTVSRITLQEINVLTMKEILIYLYTGNTKAKSDNHIALKLLAIADKYQIINLKKICELTLFKNLQINNAISTFEAADNNNALELRQKIIDFMVKNIDEIFAHADFDKLRDKKPEIMLEFIKPRSTNDEDSSTDNEYDSSDNGDSSSYDEDSTSDSTDEDS